MNLETIDQAIDTAYQAALNDPQIVAPQTIAENVTLRTDIYSSPRGEGFRIVCAVSVPEANFTVLRVRNHGYDSNSERAWPAEGIEAAAQAHVRRCIAAGAAHVVRSGFSADEKVILLNKLLKAKEDDALEGCPKLVALYAWMEQVQADAIAGKVYFAPCPHTFEEVISEPSTLNSQL